MLLDDHSCIHNLEYSNKNYRVIFIYVYIVLLQVAYTVDVFNHSLMICRAFFKLKVASIYTFFPKFFYISMKIGC